MIEIGGRSIGPGERPYIIAEVGINAGNDLRLAKRLIEVAAESGADAVKFQTHLPDEEMHEEEMRRIGAGDVYDTVSECVWSFADHRALQAHAQENEIAFLSTPFSAKAVQLLEQLRVSAIKIGSGELTNHHLISKAAEVGVPLLISTGMHTSKDIDKVAALLREKEADFSFLYCVSSYPTNPKNFDFQELKSLKSYADDVVGFSDHSTGVEAAKIAIGHGASFVEKHFTIDRRLPGPDQAVSIEPDELEDLTTYAGLFHETDSKKTNLKAEEVEIESWARHSIVTTQRIEKGEQLNATMITTKRPNSGISADKYFDVVGKAAQVDIPPNTVLRENHLKSPP